MKHIITQIRELADLNRAELGRKYNISRRTLESWENGDREAPDYTIDLLARAILEDSGRYEAVEFEVVEFDNFDEETLLSTKSITEAVREAKSSWEHLSSHDKKKNDIEIRVYESNEMISWDVIEWR